MCACVCSDSDGGWVGVNSAALFDRDSTTLLLCGVFFCVCHIQLLSSLATPSGSQLLCHFQCVKELPIQPYTDDCNVTL